MLVAVFDREGLDGREDLLTRAERRCLARGRFGARRRAEWIAGRVAARRALSSWLGADAAPVSVISAPSGAPRASGRLGRWPELSISLSHDGAWVAVAAVPGPGRAAVDLCDSRHSERVLRLLDRLSVDNIGAPLSPCAAWAGLECTLKLRGLGIASLLDARLVLSHVEPGSRTGTGTARISGLGACATVNLVETGSFALAWAEEA